MKLTDKDPSNQAEVGSVNTLDKIKHTFTSGETLIPSDLNLPRISSAIETAGFKLKLNDKQRGSLAGKQFRGYNVGRGIGLSYVLNDRLSEFKKLLDKLCAESKWSVAGDKTRGARQFAADFVSLAAGVMTREAFCEKTNRRAAKSRDHQIEDEITSLPVQAAVAIVDFFTSVPKQ